MQTFDIAQDDLRLIGRSQALFDQDVSDHESELQSRIAPSRFLIIGGAGSVGQALAKELLYRNPAALHVVDINENALAELVRDIRSSFASISCDFRLFCVDCGDEEFEALLKSEKPYTHVLYLAALKHVRSEKNPYTLMRMIRVNVINAIRVFDLSDHPDRQKFFVASTDKAANPINAMGASKAVMELSVAARASKTAVSKVRLANVAFSNGSLPQAFRERIRKRQPIAAPRDVLRYFITEKEAAQLCMMSVLLGENGETFFPKREAGLNLQTLADVAHRYLPSLGLEPFECLSEEEARRSVERYAAEGKWPCVYPVTDTTGEKVEEEFVEPDANIDRNRFRAIGVIRPRIEESGTSVEIEEFLATMKEMSERRTWTRQDILQALQTAILGFRHYETGKFLDEKM